MKMCLVILTSIRMSISFHRKKKNENFVENFSVIILQNNENETDRYKLKYIRLLFVLFKCLFRYRPSDTLDADNIIKDCIHCR